MTTPITLPPMDELTLTELRRRYEETTDAETRTRYQMLLLSLRGQVSSQIAQIVLRSQDTVVRVLKRFFIEWIGCHPATHRPWSRAAGHGCLGSRAAASDRAESP